jgi:hypothetical protein
MHPRGTVTVLDWTYIALKFRIGIHCSGWVHGGRFNIFLINWQFVGCDTWESHEASNAPTGTVLVVLRGKRKKVVFNWTCFPVWLSIWGTSAASCGCTKHPSSNWTNLQTSKLAHVPINNKLHKKSIGKCSEMRSCTSLSNVGKMIPWCRRGPALNCGVGDGPSDAALTAMSRGSLPSGDPVKTPAVCRAAGTLRPK